MQLPVKKIRLIRAAVKAFQNDISVTPTGQITGELLRLLQVAVAAANQQLPFL